MSEDKTRHRDPHIDKKTYNDLFEFIRNKGKIAIYPVYGGETRKVLTGSNSPYMMELKRLVQYHGITGIGNNNNLYVEDRIVVPIEEINNRISYVYSKFPAGRDRLFDIVQQTFYGISKRDVEQYLRESITHQSFKIPSRPKVVKPIITTKPFSHLEMDYGDLDSIPGFKILLIQDHFTKFMKGYVRSKADIVSKVEKESAISYFQYMEDLKRYEEEMKQYEEEGEYLKGLKAYTREAKKTMRKAIPKPTKKWRRIPEEPQDPSIYEKLYSTEFAGESLEKYIKEVKERFNVRKFGILHTDNGADLTGDAVKIICDKYKIKQITGRAKHPQSQGMIERGMRTIKGYIARFKLSEISVEDLQKIVDDVCAMYNNSKHGTTKERPLDIARGEVDANKVVSNMKNTMYDRVESDKIVFQIGDIVKLTKLDQTDYGYVGKDEETKGTKRHYIYRNMWRNQEFVIIWRGKYVYQSEKMIHQSKKPKITFVYRLGIMRENGQIESYDGENGPIEFYGYQMQKIGELE